MNVRLLVLVSMLGAASCRRSPAPAEVEPASDAEATLTFRRDGRVVRTLSRRELLARIPAVTFRAYDPYYAREKGWRALPLAKVLAEGFAGEAGELGTLDYVLRAKDGYAVPLVGAKVNEPGAYVAIADVDVPGWEPIGPQRANPAPFYVVWEKPEQQSLENHPRPWQLASVEITPFETTYPHVVPTGAGADAARGFAIFRATCLACHAMNREGGRVGPELNVPQSIVEYRPEAQIRAYIKDPRTFRYGNMPAHPHLTEADLDALVAYFRAMRDRKHDPDAASARADAGL
jgi:mono/diheme cytochrome c family protein